MEPQYLAYRTRRGCLLGLAAVFVAAVIASVSAAFDLPKWACIAIAAPPTGIVLAFSIMLDRRRGRG